MTRKFSLALCIALAMTGRARSDDRYQGADFSGSSTNAEADAIDARESADVVGKSRSPKTWLTSSVSSESTPCCQNSCTDCGPSCRGTHCGGCSYGPWCCDDCDCICDDICRDGIGGKYDANYFKRSNLLWVIRP